MRIRKVYILFLFLMPVLLPAQDKMLKVEKDLGMSIVNGLPDMQASVKPVKDNNGAKAARVEILFANPESLEISGSLIVDKRIEPGKCVLYMSEGLSQIEIVAPGCKPMPYSIEVASEYTYTMSLGIKVLNPMRTLIMPTFSYNKSQMSYGIMLGIGKRNGGFVHAKTDFHFGLNPQLSCDENGVVNGVQGWFNGESQKSRFAITAGYMRHLFDFDKEGKSSMCVFAGGGYGSRILAWKMYQAENSYEYARVEPYSFSGIEAELGILARFGGFSISAGVQTCQFKYLEANVGIGVMF